MYCNCIVQWCSIFAPRQFGRNGYTALMGEFEITGDVCWGLLISKETKRTTEGLLGSEWLKVFLSGCGRISHLCKFGAIKG